MAKTDPRILSKFSMVSTCVYLAYLEECSLRQLPQGQVPATEGQLSHQRVAPPQRLFIAYIALGRTCGLLLSEETFLPRDNTHTTPRQHLGSHPTSSLGRVLAYHEQSPGFHSQVRVNWVWCSIHSGVVEAGSSEPAWDTEGPSEKKKNRKKGRKEREKRKKRKRKSKQTGRNKRKKQLEQLKGRKDCLSSS